MYVYTLEPRVMREMTAQNELRQTLTETDIEQVNEHTTDRGKGLTVTMARTLCSMPKLANSPPHACHRCGVRTFSCRLAHEADQRRSTTVQIKTILGVISCSTFTARRALTVHETRISVRS